MGAPQKSAASSLPQAPSHASPSAWRPPVLGPASLACTKLHPALRRDTPTPTSKASFNFCISLSAEKPFQTQVHACKSRGCPSALGPTGPPTPRSPVGPGALLEGALAPPRYFSVPELLRPPRLSPPWAGSMICSPPTSPPVAPPSHPSHPHPHAATSRVGIGQG